MLNRYQQQDGLGFPALNDDDLFQLELVEFDAADRFLVFCLLDARKCYEN